MENLINLENLSLSKSVNEAGPHTYGCNRNSERIYVTKDYSSYWYRSIVERWCKGLRNSYYPRDENLWKSTSNINLSKKKLKQIPFGIHFITELNKLDVSGNQFTKIPHLLKKLCLRTLYIHNNPNLNHLPDFLWSMPCLIELKIDGKLIKDLPKNAQFSLDKKSLEDKIVDLTLTGKYERGMSDQDLSNMTGPYTVHLKKN